MNQPKISIIVPVHNAGDYLQVCLNSLIRQTLKEIEIILVIDCPSDGSDNVAEAFAEKDRRVKLIYNSENLHTGLSRNKGIEFARGKYIGFVDHDDYCAPEMYELLYEKSESEQTDATRCNYNCIYTSVDRDGVEVIPYNYPEEVTDVQDKLKIYESVCSNKVSCVIWNHIYKADFLNKHNLRFLDSRNICSEDSVFFINVYDKIEKIGLVEDYSYSHVFHNNNTGKIYNYRSIRNRISFLEELYDFLKRKGIEEGRTFSFLSVNAVKSLYTGARQAIIVLPLKKSIPEIKQIRSNKLTVNVINHIHKQEKKSVLFGLKPTVIMFSFIIRMFSAPAK